MAIITARYPGVCSVCGQSVSPGEKIEYTKGAPVRHAKCEPVAVPADAIHLSGGSGYGCEGWTVGEVVQNPKRRHGSTRERQRTEFQAVQAAFLATWKATHPAPVYTLWDGAPKDEDAGPAPSPQFDSEHYPKYTPEYEAWRARKNVALDDWKKATDFDRRKDEWDNLLQAYRKAEREAVRQANEEAGKNFPDNDGPEYLFVLTASSRYILEDGMSFGVGDERGHVHEAVCRPASEEEARPLREEEARRAQRAAAHAELRRIADEIQKRGEYPEGAGQVPQGDELVWDGAERRIYGGGRWFVVGPEWIWSVVNNGHDGDFWGSNNVRTGGAGAIGHRVPFEPELASTIRRLWEVAHGDDSGR